MFANLAIQLVVGIALLANLDFALFLRIVLTHKIVGDIVRTQIVGRLIIHLGQLHIAQLTICFFLVVISIGLNIFGVFVTTSFFESFVVVHLIANTLLKVHNRKLQQSSKSHLNGT